MILHSSSFNSRLRDFVTLFFQDLRAFGVFACHGIPKKDLVESYIRDRPGLLDFILREAEPLLGIAPENASLPVLANTLRWPEHAPIAGYCTQESGINYSHLLATYFGNWVFEYSHGPFYIRLIRAALWMWYRHGLESAVQYLFDLQKYGYFTLEKGVEDTVAILIASQTLGGDIQEIVAAYFNGKVPQSEADWMNWDFQIPQSAFAVTDASVAQPILESIIMDILDEIENVRALDDPVEWLLSQAALTTRCGQVERLCNRFPIKQTQMLKSILNQFEEIHADGSVYVTYRTWEKFTPLKSPLSLQASYLLLIFRTNFGDKGEERLYQDRLIYPSVLRDVLGQRGVKALSEKRDLFEWSIIPPRIYHPYTVFFSTAYPDLAARREYFPVEQVAEVPVVRQFFAQQGIQNQEERLAHLDIVYLGRIQLMKRALDSDAVPEAALTPEQEKQLSEVLFTAHSALCAKELQEDLIAAINTADTGERGRALERLYLLYPWYPAIYQELAILYDERGDLQQAWDYILTAVLLEPRNALAWQSLGVIIRRLGDQDGARFAQAMRIFLQEGEKEEQ